MWLVGVRRFDCNISNHKQLVGLPGFTRDFYCQLSLSLCFSFSLSVSWPVCLTPPPCKIPAVVKVFGLLNFSRTSTFIYKMAASVFQVEKTNLAAISIHKCHTQPSCFQLSSPDDVHCNVDNIFHFALFHDRMDKPVEKRFFAEKK
jgi:hypothetical protein